MDTYFKKGSHSARKKIDLDVISAKTATFDKKGLRKLGLKIWNFLPEDIQNFTFLPKFTEFIKPHGMDLNANATSANNQVYNYNCILHSSLNIS